MSPHVSTTTNRPSPSMSTARSVDPSAGHLHVDAPSEGRQRRPVPGPDVLGEGVERGEQRGEHVERRGR